MCPLSLLLPRSMSTLPRCKHAYTRIPCMHACMSTCELNPAIVLAMAAQWRRSRQLLFVYCYLDSFSVWLREERRCEAKAKKPASKHTIAGRRAHPTNLTAASTRLPFEYARGQNHACTTKCTHVQHIARGCLRTQSVLNFPDVPDSISTQR